MKTQKLKQINCLKNITKILHHCIVKIFLICLFFSTHLISAETTLTPVASDNITTYPGDFESTTFEDEIFDPLEPINRAIFSFNNALDKIVLEPAAKGYRKLPSPVQTGLSNFLSNLKHLLLL